MSTIRISSFYRSRSLHRRILASLQRQMSKSGKNSILGTLSVGFEAVKGTVIELMAKRMSEKDMHLFAKHWEGSINLFAKHNQPHETTEPKSEFEELSLIPKAEVEHSPGSKVSCNSFSALQQDTFTRKGDVELFHPVLGELLVDLGYKKLFLTNVRSLALAPIWKKNRILRPERAALIAKNKIKNGLGSKLAGALTFYSYGRRDEPGGSVGIIDGQHRAGALLSLAQQG